MKHLEYRASSVPRIIACPASAHGEGPLIDEDIDVGRIGTCGHEIAAAMIDAGAPTTPNPEPYLRVHNVERYGDDIDFLALQTCRLWHGFKDIKGLSAYFPNPQVEIRRAKTIEVRGHTVTLSGHLDVSSFAQVDGGGMVGRVLDWKMGYKSESGVYIDQMKAYAALQAWESKQVKSVAAIIGWLRDGYYEVFKFTRAELSAWAKKFFTEDIWWDGQTYKPGWACEYCPRRYKCPGRTQQIQEMALAFGPGGEMRERTIELARGVILPADLFDYAVTRALDVRNAADKFLGLAKRAAEEHGPFPIPESPGKAWGIRTRKGRTKINVQAAWDIIAQVIPLDELARIVEVGKSKLEGALRDQAPRGNKGKFAADVMQKLDDAGALQAAPDVKLLEIIDIEKEP